jgi:hypothetical protein
MWTESNGAVCRDACAKSRPPKGGAAVHGQPCSTLCGMFVHSFYFINYYFLELHLELHLMIFFTDRIFRRPIIASWGRDMGTICRPIQISIQICGWRQDRLVDPIKIGSTGSPTLRLKTCVRLVVSQLLEALHQYRTPSLRSLPNNYQPCHNYRRNISVGD